jgi:hypothetical protein
VIKRILLAIGLGGLVTLMLGGAAQIASNFGAESLAQILFWPNVLTQSFVPCLQIGTPQHPVCEGTPLNFLAFLESIVLSVVIYSALAYVWLQRQSRRV